MRCPCCPPRAQGLPITVETCPHYLTHAAEDIPDGATEFKCAPPIRGRKNREALWQCTAPARLAGIEAQKEAIVAGRRADLVAWQPETRFSCEPAQLFHRHPLTPYDGRTLFGEVVATWLGGRKVFSERAHHGPPQGRVLLDSAP